MYESHWNLSRKPFRNDLDISFAFMWEGYEEALARLQYWAADGKRLALLAGPSGIGKSYLLALLTRDIRRRGDIVATVPNPSLSPTEFLQYVLTLYGHDEGGLSKSDALALLTQYAGENAAQNIRTYLLVDDAQAVADRDTLEEISLILNLTERARPLFNIVLAGELQLRNVLAESAGLRQKIEISAELQPLKAAEATGYVSHRLQAAGGAGGIFQPKALEALYKWSRGVPRLINTGADLALLAAFGEGKQQVDVASLEAGLEELRNQTSAT